MSERRNAGRPGFDRRVFLEAAMLAGAGLTIGGLPFGAFAQDRRLTTVGGTARTTAGRARGLLKDGVHQFFCVPYCAPTCGAYRFMPPQAPASLSGVKDHIEITWAAASAPDAQKPAPVVTALNR